MSRPDPHVTVAGDLINIGKPAVEPLIAALKHKDKAARIAIAEILGKIGDVRAVEPLITALKDKESEVREAAAKSLGGIGDTRAVMPLIYAFKIWGGIWNGGVLCEAAAEALGKFGDSRAVEPLIAALKHKNWHVRETAAKALEKLGWHPDQGESAALYWTAAGKWEKAINLGTLAVTPLIAALQNADKYSRSGTAKALGEIGDARVVMPLIDALKDSDWCVRKAAAEALVKMYYEATLDEHSKKSILAVRQIITASHVDYTVVPGYHGPMHEDKGIGVAFPL